MTVSHSLAGEASAEPAIVERQSYILVPVSPHVGRAGPRKAPAASSCSQVVTPDEIMLFQYSALGFNSHKIHLDRAHARDVEGLPDLVVNGGLITLLMTEFLRTAFGARPSRIRTRHLAPLYCGRPVTLSATRDTTSYRLEASDEAGLLAAEMEADVP